MEESPDIPSDVSPAPDVPPVVVEEATRAADEALRLLREARYPELLEQAAEWSALSAPLELLRDEIRAGADFAAPAADEVRRLRERIHALRETLRHAAMVEHGLREIEAALHAGYSARGQLETERATRLSAEA